MTPSALNMWAYSKYIQLSINKYSCQYEPADASWLKERRVWFAFARCQVRILVGALIILTDIKVRPRSPRDIVTV